MCVSNPVFFAETWQVCQLVKRQDSKIGRCIIFKINLLEGTFYQAAVELLFSYALTVKCRAMFIIAIKAIQMENVGVQGEAWCHT